MNEFSQNRTTDRQPFAAGRFYPADKSILLRELSEMFESCKKTAGILDVQAIISPHAGYVFSGRTAASAFSSIKEHSVFRNIFILASSHVMAFEGASVYSKGDYHTPLGRVRVNREIARQLIAENKVFEFPDTCHIREHSIEVQLPLIQYYLGEDSVIVPVIIGTDNKKKIREIAESLKQWFNNENLFIISSDFSHYPSYSDAYEVDKATAGSYISGDPARFLDTLNANMECEIPGLVTSMCGWTSGLVLLYLTEGNSMLEFSLIDYCNSGDSPAGSKNGVVGYHAISLIKKSSSQNVENAEIDDFKFNSSEKEILFSIAKTSILKMLVEKKIPDLSETSLPDKLKKTGGAFVTLKLNGRLKGCIGRFISSDPLYKVVQLSAISSAFEDPRFTPLTAEEFEMIKIEITVLGPLRKINNITEIVLGKHGIYIKQDFRTGTMLPQVATENGWSVEEFLGYTSRDKVGIGWDGWRNAEIYIYEGIVLEE